MEKINGWIVVADIKGNNVPVDHKFYMAKDCAICLRGEMNMKKAIEPETHLYPYKIKKAILMVGK